MFAPVALIEMPLLLLKLILPEFAVIEPEEPLIVSITELAFAYAEFALEKAGSICGATLFAAKKAALACMKAPLAYRPEFTALVSAIFAALKAEFA